MPLWLHAQWATLNFCRDGLNIRTTGSQPPNATVLSCVCKQEWKAQGCQPWWHQPYIVSELLEWGSNPDLVSDRGNTVLMEIAGVGNVAMFNFFYERILNQAWTCDLTVENTDGRNLWSIAGLAHDPGETREEVGNRQIKEMIKHLAVMGFLSPSGLATYSSARRCKRRRTGHNYAAQEYPSPQRSAVASSSTRPLASRSPTSSSSSSSGSGSERVTFRRPSRKWQRPSRRSRRGS